MKQRLVAIYNAIAPYLLEITDLMFEKIEDSCEVLYFLFSVNLPDIRVGRKTGVLFSTTRQKSNRYYANRHSSTEKK
jgi:hypothetical protein